MNYRHAYHAGNFADVLKHMLLARVLEHLALKDAPYRLLDSHAGVGIYDLASDEALRTGEWHGGIGRLIGADLPDPLARLLQPLMRAVAAVNGGGDLLLYPGSPAIAAALGRIQDRFVFNERHPEDCAALATLFAADRRVRVTGEDGWTAVRAELPPRERRGLLLVDPPFEEAGEYARLAKAMRDAARRFATGTQMLWYPIKDLDAVGRFHDAVAAGPVPRVLRVEQWIRRLGGDGPLSGAGLLVVNPPWTLADELRTALPALTALLAAGDGAGWRCDWLVPERPAAAERDPG